ncbi:hypothetical protein BKA56DRAFT_349334 [Ilyonectria sp. MPI-CAGE-AT-0026]|nr:hypothetical protein BKA56DRAFT_349334 [Ilyonectria sp. MPI-CAGE-AT-0026]
MFNRRVKSHFTLDDVHVGQVITVADVDFTFTYRRAEDQCDEPRSRWGRCGGERVCLLYFDFGIDEKGQKNGINSAEAKISFSESGCPQLELLRVAPKAENVDLPAAEREFTQGVTIEPTVDTPFGSVSLLGYHQERTYEGLPDWRFRSTLGGNRPSKVATWTWTRGSHYSHARGVPGMKVGVVAKDHPNKPFLGAVTLKVSPWWRTKTKEFLIPFDPPSPESEDDLSNEVTRFP